MAVTIKVLGEGDADILDRVAPEVFDDPTNPESVRRFLADPQNHLAVAIHDSVVIGFVSAVHYDHPDYPTPELFINEIGVAPYYQRQGIGTCLMQAILDVGRQVGCAEAWVLTDLRNKPAMGLYASCGGEPPTEHVMVSFSLAD